MNLGLPWEKGSDMWLGWSTFWLALGVYLVGAAIAWRIAYGRCYGKLYQDLARCGECVSRAASNDNVSLGCYRHSRTVYSTYQQVLWIALFWPFVLLGLSVFRVVMLMVMVVNRVCFPRGNRNNGYLTWNRAIAGAKYKTNERELRMELVRLGINSEEWFPRDLKLEPANDLSSRQLESEGQVLGRKLAEVRASLKLAKEISAMEGVALSQKRKAIQATLVAPHSTKVNGRHDDVHIEPL